MKTPTPTWKETIESTLRRVFLEGLADGGTGGAMDDVVAENLVAINKAVLELVADAKPEILTTKDGSDPWTRGVEGTKQGLLKLLGEK